MSKSSDSLKEDFIRNRDEKDYRHSYADESLNITIGTQLKVLREQRNWRQEDLAEKAQMKQSMISRYEDVNYSSWSIKTLKKLAEAFDVVLDVRFRSFGDLVKATETFSRKSLEVPSFADDPFFKEQPKQATVGTVTLGGSYATGTLVTSLAGHLTEILYVKAEPKRTVLGIQPRSTASSAINAAVVPTASGIQRLGSFKEEAA